jgi:hypothetical protein
VPGSTRRHGRWAVSVLTTSIGRLVTPEETLIYESRVRDRRVVVAVLAGVFLVLASVLQLSGPHTKVDELTVDLLVANQRFPLDLIAAIINAIASLAIAWTLVSLYQSAHARDPAKVRPYVKYIAIVAGSLAALAGVVYAVVVAIKVHEFATTGAQTYTEANHLTSGPGLLGLQLLGQLAALLMAVAFVLVSLQAMNTGLLSRFMGYLGMFAGALVLFQITQVPVVQCYWLLALAYLISGRWPTGVPPAWRSGAKEPWPSSAEMRTRRAAAASARAETRRGRGAKPATAAGPEVEAAEAVTAPRTRASTPKRKRKRRT